MEKELRFIVIDEIATLDKITSLHKLLTLGAGYKSSCWFGVQSISDIEEIYGRNLKESLVTNVRTKVVLKQGDPKTAAWCADLLLKREVKEKQLSHSVGGVDSRDSYSASEQRKELYNVSPSDLLSLDNLERYIHSGKLLKKIKVPIFQKKEYLAPKESSNLGA